MKFIALFIMAAVLLAVPVMAADLCYTDDDSIVKCPEIIPLEYTKQTDNTKFIVKEDGFYINDERKAEQGSVWIDKQVGTTYHVDSTNDEDVTVTLVFNYNVQPDYIDHYNHQRQFVRRYHPGEWAWQYDTDGHNPGTVTIEVSSIDKGTGSNTFPIGVNGSKWSHDGYHQGEFNGLTTYIDLDNHEQIKFYNRSFSVSGWFKPKGDSVFLDQYIIDGKTAGGGTTRGFNVYYETNSSKLWALVGNGSNTDSIAATPTTNVGEWSYFAFIVDREGDTTSLCVNGVNKTLSLDIKGNLSSQLDLFIGTANAAGTPLLFSNGSIDEFRIYNRTLNSSEIVQLYNYNRTKVGTAPSTEGLVLYIDFDDYSPQDKSVYASLTQPYSLQYNSTEIFERDVPSTAYTTNAGIFTVADNSFGWTGMNVSYNWADAEAATRGARTVLHLVGVFIGLVALFFIFRYVKEVLDI